MSQSPLSDTNVGAQDEYVSAWDDLGRFLAQGRSFSGHERKCCFLNTGGGRFAQVAGITGLDRDDDGRAVCLVDWDRDGDLDLWLANRTGPRVRFVRNDISSGNGFVALRLLGVDCNRDAIGARVEVRLAGDSPVTYLRTLRAGDAFLSQSSKWIHFGIPQGATIASVIVRWPGESSAEVFSGVNRGGFYELVQHARRATSLTIQPVTPLLEPVEIVSPPSTSRARLALTNRPRLPSVSVMAADRTARKIPLATGKPVLVNLWASWCGPCAKELQEMSSRADDLRAAGIEVLAVSVDDLTLDAGGDADAASQFLTSIRWPFASYRATQAVVDDLTKLHNSVVYEQGDLPLPTSFLVDPAGNVAVIYKGPVDVEQLLTDVNLLGSGPGRWEATAFPFPGRSALPLFPFDSVSAAMAYREGGYLDEARAKLREFLDRNARLLSDPTSLSETGRESLYRAWRLLATIEHESGRERECVEASQAAIKLRPDASGAHAALGVAIWRAGDPAKGRRVLEAAAELARDRPQDWRVLGRAWRSLDQPSEALRCHEKANQLDPRNIAGRLELARAYRFAKRIEEAVRVYSHLLAEQPMPAQAASELAWLWATWPEKKHRRGANALQLANRVSQSTGGQIAEIEAARAAALAETGNLGDALTAAKAAQKLAVATGQLKLADRITLQRTAYEAGRVYLDDGGQSVE